MGKVLYIDIYIYLVKKKKDIVPTNNVTFLED